MMNTTELKIYVACLAAYNSGYLHGTWIDATQDINVMRDEINKMLALSPAPDAEEYAIHDYDFGGICIDEYESLETITRLTGFIIEHGDLGTGMLSYFSNDLEYATQLLEDCYYGEYDSEVDFVEEFAADNMDIPENLVNYIDYERMARDWFIDDFFSIEINHKTHIFSKG